MMNHIDCYSVYRIIGAMLGLLSATVFSASDAIASAPSPNSSHAACVGTDQYSNPSTGEKEKLMRVKVVFWGNRPAEYLAEFYNRIAECNPQYLEPHAIYTMPISSVEATKAIPVVRSKLAVGVYAVTTERLGAYLREEGDADVVAGEPGLEAKLIKYKLSKRVSHGVIERDKEGSAFLVRAAKYPGIKKRTQICHDMLLEENCFGPEDILPFLSRKTGQALSYYVDISHFKLEVTLRVPRSHGEDLIIDAINAVERTLPNRGDTAGATRPYYFLLDVADVPLSQLTGQLSSPGITHHCTIRRGPKKEIIDKECAPIRIGGNPEAVRDNAFHKAKAKLDRIKAAIHWTAPNTLLHSTDIKITISDPGFLATAASVTLAENCARVKIDNECVKKAWGVVVDNKWNQNYRPWLGAMDKSWVGDDDQRLDFGHGLHMAYLAAGGGFLGLNSQDDHPELKLIKSSEDNTLNVEGLVPAKKRWVINRSYKLNTREPKFSYETVVSAHNEDRNSKALKAHMSVISSPLLPKSAMNASEGQAYVKLSCASQAPEIVCLAAHKFGIGVVPARIIASADNGAPDSTDYRLHQWTIMHEPPLSSSQSVQYAIENDTGLLWIAAPGEGVVSLDAIYDAGSVTDDGGGLYAVGFGARTGASPATAIVTSLVARASQQFPSLELPQIKRWLFANATPFAPNHNAAANAAQIANAKFATDVVGMISFGRTLDGTPDQANIWRIQTKKDKDAGNCRKIFRECLEKGAFFLVHKEFVHTLRTVENDSKVIAILRAANDKNLYVLRQSFSDENCAKQNMEIPCFGFSKTKITIQDEIRLEEYCKLRNINDGDEPCLSLMERPTGPAILGADTPISHPIDFSKVTHAIGIMRENSASDHWRVLDDNQRYKALDE